MPAAQRYIADAGLNELFDGDADRTLADLGLIVPGGLYDSTVRALQLLGLADVSGACRVPILVLNVVYPLVPKQIRQFCASRRAVLIVEEGQPEFIEQDIATTLRRADIQTPLHGKDFLPMGGECNAEVVHAALLGFLSKYAPGLDLQAGTALIAQIAGLKRDAAGLLQAPVPARPPNFCTGCPERPVFAALKLVEREVGQVHVCTDIGCHSFATFAPFSFGQSILGYGMSLASGAAVKNFSTGRPVAIMGDGGFWHNGLLSGVSSTLLNQGDGVLVIMKDGYTSATGTQETVSTPVSEAKRVAEGSSATVDEMTIKNTLKGMGMKWIKTVHNYRVGKVRAALKDALSTPFAGLKVIIAEGECQLERQRRMKPIRAARLKQGLRSTRIRYGVDEDTCTGDHACIRLSGCPSLTIKTPSDPLKRNPVALVDNSCVGCGLCGEVADAAVLCPSFYHAEIITHPHWWERASHHARPWLIRQAAVPFDTPDIEEALEGEFVVDAVEHGPDGDELARGQLRGQTAFSKLVAHMHTFSPEWAQKICDVPGLPGRCRRWRSQPSVCMAR